MGIIYFFDRESESQYVFGIAKAPSAEESCRQMTQFTFLRKEGPRQSFVVR